MTPDLDRYLAPTPFIESEHPAGGAFARETTADVTDPVDAAVRLFYAVRDRIRYDPYSASMEPDVFRAGTVLAEGTTFCVPKAILLTAAGRAVGIPSRLRFADVRNHLASKRLLALMRTDVFCWHGYSEFLLEDRWVKATPTFNLTLCERFGVKPLDFDGRHDAIFHPLDRAGRRHMEYVRDHGSHADLPYEQMVAGLREIYPWFFDASGRWRSMSGSAADFEAEAASE